jgi:hypothetical protein
VIPTESRSDITSPPKRRSMDPFRNYADSTSSEPDTKRRKLRKGTTSCWDCKKRKVKCTYDDTSDTICIPCRRRGAPCIGQDKPEEEFQAQNEGNRDPLIDRIQRVESLLERLLEVGHRVERDINTTAIAAPTQKKSGYFTPASDDQGPEPYRPQPTSSIATSTITIDVTDENRKISEELIKEFPKQHEIDGFCKLDYLATFYCHQLVTNSDHPEHEAFDFVNNLATIPDASMHPVLVAKRMLLLALFLQYFKAQGWNLLPDHPSAVMARLIDTAVRLVTTNENLVCCIDGLECIILEGLFHIKGGNLRRAWLAFRKGMTMAQLMKFDLPNPAPVKTLDGGMETNPKFMWFRLVFMDVMLSLMLGLPHGGQASDILEHDIPGETPSCKLERMHTLVGRRIIERNRCEVFPEDLNTTRELDQMLLKTARALPDKFWAPPNFSALQPNTREAFWEIMRMCDQVHHYNLVHLLHLPYLLRCDKESSYNTYAKIACVTAARELLHRFIAYRHFNFNASTVYCRSADFLALMAAMTLLLAHIDSHRLRGDDWRAHQRLGDRALVEQLLVAVDMIGERADDSLSRKGAEQLRSLLKAESDAARGMELSAHSTVRDLEQSSGELQLHIPYYGIIKIGQEGITKNDSSKVKPNQIEPNDIRHSVYVANHVISTAGFGDALQQESQPQYFLPMSDTPVVQGSQTPIVGANLGDDLDQHQLQNPSLMANVNDWAFQGVDTAFFDSVMRGATDWDAGLRGNV